jgi:hypothetical protein
MDFNVSEFTTEESSDVVAWEMEGTAVLIPAMMEDAPVRSIASRLDMMLLESSDNE